ncbi:hypothetical protein HDU81_008334 [Chytriomyces hyalinus]|nr:hypothetical protein HDU81_008334 [Chytriomyces hyalinus]
MSLLEPVILSQYAHSPFERNLSKIRNTFKNWFKFTPDKERTDPSLKVVQLWNIRLDQLGVDFSTFSSLVLSSKFNVAAVGGIGQYIALLSLTTGELVAAPYRVIPHSVNSLCLDEVAGIVLSGYWDGFMAAYDISTHTILGTQQNEGYLIADIQSGPSVVAVLSIDSKVSIWSRNVVTAARFRIHGYV